MASRRAHQTSVHAVTPLQRLCARKLRVSDGQFGAAGPPFQIWAAPEGPQSFGELKQALSRRGAPVVTHIPSVYIDTPVPNLEHSCFVSSLISWNASSSFRSSSVNMLVRAITRVAASQPWAGRIRSRCGSFGSDAFKSPGTTDTCQIVGEWRWGGRTDTHPNNASRATLPNSCAESSVPYIWRADLCAGSGP